VNVTAIPAELRERRQWVVWRSETRDGKPTKVPYVARPPLNRGAASGTRRCWRASTTDPSTWRSFTEAVTLTRDGGWDGIGFVFSADDPYVGVDLDAGLSEGDRGAIMLELDSYSETSVSGNGAHVIVRASLNGYPRNRRGPIEVYGQGRYFVVTGQHIHGTPATIEERQVELETVLAEFLPAPSPAEATAPVVPVDFDDRELLERAFAARNGGVFRELWEGRWHGRYSSQSEADLALCSMLAFWTGRDAGRIDTLFRSSGLMREKWNRDDYRERTIESAIEGCRETYEQARTPRP
jgi:primase-polymerase (primpol)-like protein